MIRIAALFFRRRERSGHGIDVSEVESSDSRLAVLWQKVRDKYPLMVVRDQDFLSWRFSKVSDREYRILLAEVEGEVAGYIVLRCATVRGVLTGLVVDFLVGEAGWCHAAGCALVEAAERQLRAMNACVVAAMMMPFSDEYKVLKNMGYVHLSPTIRRARYYLQLVVHEEGRRIGMKTPARDCFVTIADWEAY